MGIDTFLTLSNFNWPFRFKINLPSSLVSIFTLLYATAAPHFGAPWPISPFKHLNQAPSDAFHKKGTARYEMRGGDVSLQAILRGLTAFW
jgi:hypothetical protein